MQELFLQENNLDEVASQAAKVMSDGGVIVYPTETAYGLGADYFNEEAVDKIFAIKQRDTLKPLPVIVADWEAAEKLVVFNDKIRQLAVKYWPGALTIVLPFKLVGQKKHFLDTLGLRISSHSFCLKLAKIFKNPIISTSANISKQSPIYSISEIKEQFSQQKIKPDLLINAGDLPLTLPSTIIKSENDKIEVLRQGKIQIK